MAEFEVIRSYQNHGYFTVEKDGEEFLRCDSVCIDGDTMTDPDDENLYESAEDWAECRFDEIRGDEQISNEEEKEIIRLIADEYYIILDAYL